MHGPPDKWIAINISTQNDTRSRPHNELLLDLNRAAAAGYIGSQFSLICSDGSFLFIPGYSEPES